MLLIASTSALLPFPPPLPPPPTPFYRCHVALDAGNRLRDACSASFSLACRVIGSPNNGSFRRGAPVVAIQCARGCRSDGTKKKSQAIQTDRGGCSVSHVSESRRCGESSRDPRNGAHRNYYLFVYPRWILSFRGRTNVCSRKGRKERGLYVEREAQFKINSGKPEHRQQDALRGTRAQTSENATRKSALKTLDNRGGFRRGCAVTRECGTYSTMSLWRQIGGGTVFMGVESWTN